jgi:hypothetical protein
MEPKPMAASERTRAIWQEHLAQAERHVVLGEGHIAKQQAIVADLERDGHDVRAARDLLNQLEQMLELHLANRDRLRKELGMG